MQDDDYLRKLQQLQEQEEQEELERLEQEMLEQEELERQAKIAELRGKLNKIKSRLQKAQFHLAYLPSERRTVKQAKQFKELQVLRESVHALHLKKLAKTVEMIIENIHYIAIGVLIALAVLIVIIAVAAIVANIFAWLQSDSDKKEMNAVAGASGSLFYGNRVVYEDAEQAHISMLKDYASIVGECVQAVENENADIDILIEVPTDNYDYKNLPTDTNYQSAYKVVKDMLNTSFIYDNPETTEENLQSMPIVDITAGIKYFGFDDALNEQIKGKIMEIFILTEMYEYNAPSENGLTVEEINTLIENKISSLLDGEKYNYRVEKLFVKDYIFNSAEDMMENIVEKNYKCMIFMPKKSVNFTSFSFIVVGVDENFVMTINGKNFNKKIFYTDEDGTIAYEYYLRTTEQAGEFADIDKNNLTLLATETSLFDVFKMDNYTTFLQGIEQNEQTVYTYKSSGLKVEFDNGEDGAFMFAEAEIKVS